MTQILPAEKLVVLDESGIEIGAPSRMARSPAGSRAYVQAPLRGKRLTLLGAIRLSGLVDLQVYEGKTDGRLFDQWVEERLAPALQPGDIVLLDNASIHLGKRSRQAIEAVGAEMLFLPAYSPEYSPIEPYWSKVKLLARRFAAGTEDAIHAALAAAIEKVTDSDILAWFKHCGWSGHYA